MTAEELFQLSGAIIISIGGGSALIFALSSWLGKVWADRIMQTERANHEKSLEALRHDLIRANEKELAEMTHRLDIYKQQYLSGYNDKIKIYRLVVDLLVDLLSQFNTSRGNGSDSESIRAMQFNFNRERMRAYGYLIMLAPQHVMDAYDNLIDHLLSVLHDGVEYDWTSIRNLYICLANEVRKDIGIDIEPIFYNGLR